VQHWLQTFWQMHQRLPLQEQSSDAGSGAIIAFLHRVSQTIQLTETRTSYLGRRRLHKLREKSSSARFDEIVFEPLPAARQFAANFGVFDSILLFDYLAFRGKLGLIDFIYFSVETHSKGNKVVGRP
jgi:hypothetical protein